MSHVYPPNSDGDSEDDLEHFHEREARLLEQYSSGATPYPIRVADGGERQVRAHQLLRGQMTSKRVASKSAISSLQSVEIDTLPESERSKFKKDLYRLQGGLADDKQLVSSATTSSVSRTQRESTRRRCGCPNANTSSEIIASRSGLRNLTAARTVGTRSLLNPKFALRQKL